MQRYWYQTAIVSFAAWLSAAPAWAHDGPHAESPKRSPKAAVTTAPAGRADIKRAQDYFGETELLTHEGKRVRFFSDVLKDRVVAVTFFFTSCTGACPVTNQKLSYVQDLLGERFGKDIFFISISVEPEKDTPDVIRSYREKFNARDGWVFLTGEKGKVERVSKRLGQVYDRDAHLPLLLVGNLRTGHWMKLLPNLPHEAVALRLQMLADERVRE